MRLHKASSQLTGSTFFLNSNQFSLPSFLVTLKMCHHLFLASYKLFLFCISIQTHLIKLFYLSFICAVALCVPTTTTTSTTPTTIQSNKFAHASSKHLQDKEPRRCLTIRPVKAISRQDSCPSVGSSDWYRIHTTSQILNHRKCLAITATIETREHHLHS